MAVKPSAKLSFIDIVTKADADVIRQALEARLKIDDLLIVRDEAYKKIFEIENEIEDICGEEGTFEFGETPYPVAGLSKKKPKKKPAPKKEADEEKPEETETTEGEADAEAEAEADADAEELSYKSIEDEEQEKGEE